MQITDLNIDRFCDLENVSLKQLSVGLNVICGPTGSGKSTLVRFLREMMYGFKAPLSETQHQTIGRMLIEGRWGSQRVERVVTNTQQERLVFEGDHGTTRTAWTNNVEPTALDHIFCFGFKQRPSLKALAACLDRQGFQLSHHGDSDAQLEQLRSQRANLQAQIDSIDSTWDALQQATRQLRAEVDSIQWTESPMNPADLHPYKTDRWSAHLKQMDQDLDDHRTRRRQLRQIDLQEVERQIEELEGRAKSSLLRAATEYYARLTTDEYKAVTLHSICMLGTDVWLEDAHGQRIQVHQLEATEVDQLYLAICLAAVQEYRRLDIQLPFVLDDICGHGGSDGNSQACWGRHDTRAKNTSTVLAEFARQGHQVIVTTQHNQLAEHLQLNGAQTYRLAAGNVARPVETVVKHHSIVKGQKTRWRKVPLRPRWKSHTLAKHTLVNFPHSWSQKKWQRRG